MTLEKASKMIAKQFGINNKKEEIWASDQLGVNKKG
jgi:hypothetical protein